MLDIPAAVNQWQQQQASSNSSGESSIDNRAVSSWQQSQQVYESYLKATVNQ